MKLIPTGMTGAAIALLFAGVGMRQARADFSCQLYSGPISNPPISSDSGLRSWLYQSDASNPNGSLKLVGSFQADAAGKLVFKSTDGSSDKSFPFPASSIPGSSDALCNTITDRASCNGSQIAGRDLGNCAPFSCYSTSIYSHFSSFPMPHGMNTETLDTPVYQLSQGINNSWGARSALFLAGSDCESIASAANSGWMSNPGQVMTYLQNIAKTSSSSDSVDDADAASDSTDAPAGAATGGSDSGGYSSSGTVNQ